MNNVIKLFHFDNFFIFFLEATSTKAQLIFYVTITIIIVIFSDVKISFCTQAHLVFHWCLYNKNKLLHYFLVHYLPLVPKNYKRDNFCIRFIRISLVCGLRT